MMKPMTSHHSSSDDATRREGIREEAHVWLGLLAAGDVRQADLRAFRRWQLRDPEHAAAFDEAKRQWHATKPALGRLLQADEAIARRHHRLMGEPRMGRRAFLGAALGTAAMAGMVVLHPPMGLWPTPAEWRADERTGIGEMRTLHLPEAISVALNTQSSIRRHAVGAAFSGIDLIKGEAAVDLGGTGLPFAVVAGAGRAIAETGRFQVRHLDDTVCVTCIEGRLRIEHPAGERELHDRQQLVYDAHAFGATASVDPDDATAWRRGEIVFRNVPLERVIDEINRYRQGRIVLMAPSKRKRRVSGRFRVAILDEVLLQLQRTFDLRARTLPAGVVVLS
ncbi:FecR family protein [Luteimonas sp. R10]|uniref:FecR family protein n=1 Tax=Luteimonas sp. R10 TaxID=3108176 RepID=UPI003085C0D9|nr:FecR domain-containing protein [Luteimonas sp. R10]